MQLDLFTIVLMLMAICFLVGTGIFISWLQTRSEPGLLFWSISLLLRVPTFSLYMLRGQIPDRMSIDLANTFLLAAAGVGWAATRLYTKREVNLFIAALPAITWVFVCQVPWIYDDIDKRVFIISTFTMVYSIAIAVDFWRDAAVGRGLRRSLAVLFLINATMHGTRGFVVATQGVPEDMFVWGNAIAGALFIQIILVITGSLLGIGLHREKYMHSLKHDAAHDPLTNTLNRRAFFAEGDKLLMSHNMIGTSTAVALLVFDLDHFKKINDTYGHLGGDQVLKNFSRIIKCHLRRSDLFGRLGGEEFAALLRVSSREDGEMVAEKLRKAVSAESTSFGDRDLPVTVSIGISEYSGKAPGLDVMMNEADAALYEAKQKGRNRVCQYQKAPAMDIRLVETESGEPAVVAAVAR